MKHAETSLRMARYDPLGGMTLDPDVPIAAVEIAQRVTFLLRQWLAH
jgi:hypothetical protein